MNRSMRRVLQDLIKNSKSSESSEPKLTFPANTLSLKKEALKVKPSTLVAISKTGYNMVEQYNTMIEPPRKFYESESKIYDLIALLDKLGHDYCNEDYYAGEYGGKYQRDMALCNAFVVRALHSEIPNAITEICSLLDELADRDLIYSTLSSVFIMPAEDYSFVGIYIHVRYNDQETIDKEFGLYKVEEGGQPRSLGEISDLRKNKS